MPVYDFKCPDGCGYFNDIFVPLSEHGKTTCNSCGALLETVISEVALVGPMPSKPLVVDQVVRSFESTSEFNEYQRKNPDCAVVSADSTHWRQHKDAAREKVESRAKRQGFKDREHQVKYIKKERAKRSGKLDKKIFIH